jgi:hypothetical protein
MSIYDKSSLVLIPSGTKTGKVFSQKPVSGDGDFTFTRASAATRVNADGNIEKETQNLLLQSNTFSNGSWNKNAGGTFTSGQAGYDGSNDAWQFNVTTASNSGAWQNVTFSGVATFSAYFKKGTIDKIGFTNYAGSSYECWFDLTNGTIGQQTGDLIDAKIVSVGGGWYRCSITDIASGANYFQLKPSNAYSGVSTAGNIYIQDAQVEQGLVARDYIETTTAAVYGGITDNTPRLDYTDSSCPALLLEPLRTNLLENSEYILGGDWNQLGGALSIAQNTTDTLSPEGKYNAGAITLSSTANRYFSSQGYNLGGLTAVSASVWLKTNGGELQGALAFFNGTGGDAITITEEWQRFEINKTASNSTEYLGLDFRGSYSQSGIVYCYGWQFENNASYATSYIPTYGSSVSRVADSCVKTGVSNLIGQTEGTLFMDVDLYARDSYSYFALAPNLGSTSVYIGIGITATAFSFEVVNSGVQVAYNYSNSSTGNFKLAFAYKANDFVAYVNGTQVMTDTSGSVPACSQIALHQYDKDQPFLYKQALVFKTRLTNAELADLTTL